ncbi:hypothetical protein [Budvicia aquatica]|uniref:Transposase n=1 Tax=Budvicia aquatica TaxID=82979 RepID=A0A484ZGL8_9GAMM|nr:hypothetical protein [Budvicia aquatica]VFS47148.1 Uncharacterised protein [Budvicia aquatica]
MTKYFTAEFKLEAAKLVVDQKYFHSEAEKAMNVSFSALSRWGVSSDWNVRVT